MYIYYIPKTESSWLASAPFGTSVSSLRAATFSCGPTTSRFWRLTTGWRSHGLRASSSNLPSSPSARVTFCTSPASPTWWPMHCLGRTRLLPAWQPLRARWQLMPSLARGRPARWRGRRTLVGRPSHRLTCRHLTRLHMRSPPRGRTHPRAGKPLITA